jgi:hypothetical protein
MFGFPSGFLLPVFWEDQKAGMQIKFCMPAKIAQK